MNFEVSSSNSPEIYIDPSLEGVDICHLSFAKLTCSCNDLRDLIPALKQYGERIKPEDVVIDSDMPLNQAFQGLSSQCPTDILVQQHLVRVFYFGNDGKLHHGQVVIHERLIEDVIAAFNVLLKERIPVGSVIPIADSKFRQNDAWDDLTSMELNNSSGFNFRKIISATGQTERLSLHSLGMALDVNPLDNPCYGAPQSHNLDGYPKEAAAGYSAMVPTEGKYDLSKLSSFHERHPFVQELEKRGWTWGGRWAEPKDLHHFQKIPNELAEWVKNIREC